MEKILKDNHLPYSAPSVSQLQNYLYRYKTDLISQNYPEVKGYLTEICSKNYSSQLGEDETFVIYSKCEEGELSVLLSTRALIKNLIKQSQIQESFIHLDGTYKLIDLGLPILTVSTENIKHNFRPICYNVTWSESKEQVIIMLKELSNFLKQHFDFNLRPKFILTDNSDALISGCQNAFSHKYIHMQCHFHISKNIKDKLKSNALKDYQEPILFGIKALKNSESLSFFKHVWTLIKPFWIEKKCS